MKQHCKECKELKELDEFYTHPQWKNWVLSRCKECIKRWRRSEKERSMARINDKKRSKNPERIKYVIKNTQKYRKNNPDKRNAHKLVNNYYRSHRDEQPKICSNCWSNKKIELHHEDYKKPDEIIPLCALCHKGYHYWKIKIDTTKIIKILPKK